MSWLSWLFPKDVSEMTHDEKSSEWWRLYMKASEPGGRTKWETERFIQIAGYLYPGGESGE